MKRLSTVLALAILVMPVICFADTIVTPADTTWVSVGNSGGGSSSITDTFADSGAGQGSLELYGDRTRFIKGNPWSSDSGDAFGKLSDLNTFTFDWAIASGSSSNLNPDYTPALRLHIYEPNYPDSLHLGRGSNIELIWEGAYNGVYPSDPSRDTWFTTSSGDDFWRWDGSETTDGGVLQTLSLSEWSQGLDTSDDRWFSNDALIMAISVGVGSSAGSDYHAYADLVRLGFDGQDIETFNFEPASEIPVPAAVWLLGSGLLGLMGLRRRFSR
jgi:hypothetical protein